jgi:hypothetical protein
VKEQVKAARSAAKDFLAGRSVDAELATLGDKHTGKIGAAELLATLSDRSAGEGGQKSKVQRQTGPTVSEGSGFLCMNSSPTLESAIEPRR